MSLLTFPRLLAYAAFISTTLCAIGPVTDLTLTSAEIEPAGEGLRRQAIVFEESRPSAIGPLIRANKGEAFKINVVNNLDNDNMLKSTSIHWHGILQRGGQNWADGAAFVTQCPIAGQGHSFLYEFQEPEQTGTYWYHSHYSTQYCDGARGPLVIYDPNDPHKDLYNVDDESTVITLADWYRDFAENIIIGTSDATLINGLGRAVNGTASDLSVITVEKGKRYRLRFINIACDPWFAVSIDSHTNLTIIEADGVNTRPVPADSFNLFVGQRYSVILDVNQDVGNYWIRAGPQGVASFEGGINMAILRYQGAPDEEPNTSPDTANNTLQEQSLIPLENPGAPGIHTRGAADVVANLDMQFVNENNTLMFTINGHSWVPPELPVLLQILSGARDPQSLLPEGSFIPVKRNDIVEINFPVNAVVSGAGGPHPFHLHGHNFDIIRSAGSNTDNFETSPRRDVVAIETALDDVDSNVTIRFRADNPGPWFLHCHIDWHLELGFALVFAEATEEWNSTITPPSEWDQLCPIFDDLPEEDQ